jgi:hypothetical protein
VRTVLAKDLPADFAPERAHELPVPPTGGQRWALYSSELKRWLEDPERYRESPFSRRQLMERFGEGLVLLAVTVFGIVAGLPRLTTLVVEGVLIVAIAAWAGLRALRNRRHTRRRAVA